MQACQREDKTCRTGRFAWAIARLHGCARRVQRSRPSADAAARPPAPPLAPPPQATAPCGARRRRCGAAPLRPTCAPAASAPRHRGTCTTANLGLGAWSKPPSWRGSRGRTSTGSRTAWWEANRGQGGGARRRCSRRLSVGALRARYSLLQASPPRAARGGRHARPRPTSLVQRQQPLAALRAATCGPCPLAASTMCARRQHITTPHSRRLPQPLSPPSPATHTPPASTHVPDQAPTVTLAPRTAPGAPSQILRALEFHAYITLGGVPPECCYPLRGIGFLPCGAPPAGCPRLRLTRPGMHSREGSVSRMAVAPVAG